MLVKFGGKDRKPYHKGGGWEKIKMGVGLAILANKPKLW